jgi:tRNA nucleotidyltransferase (CCA-adding enzyme)
LISVERIREELMKTLESNHPDYVAKLAEFGALDLFYDEYAAKQDEINALLLKLPAEGVLRLTAFLGKSGKDLVHSYTVAERVLNYLKFDNDTKNSVLHVIRFSGVTLSTDRKLLRRFLNACGKENYENVLLFLEKSGDLDLTPVREVIRDILDAGECTTLKELAVSGKDLIGLGMLPGKKMGEVLMELLREVLEEPEKNTREYLLERGKILGGK